MNENEIVVADNTATPISHIDQLELVDIEYAKASQDNFIELVEALLDSSDYQGGKKKKSAWRKLARAFNISDEPITKEVIRDENHQIISAYFEVKAVLPNGRSGFGVGDCSIFDKIKADDVETPSNFELRKRFTNAEHDVIATAHTRAKSRAISDLIGAGEVSAEELENDVKVTRKTRDDNDSEDKESSSSEEPKQQKTRKRRARRTRKEPKNVQEVIETKVVESKASADDFHDIDNEAIRTCISRIEKADEEVTKHSINEELFNIYDLGDIDLEEYDEAKKALGIN